jgi:glucosamine--fructose-6-phosphate aminotransferase (isomerizing)
MKHGPIALADPELFTIALMPKNMLYDKIKSNVEELSARDSTICAISSADFELADDFIKINKCDHYMLGMLRDEDIVRLVRKINDGQKGTV